MLNVAVIMGRLTADPELRTTGNGVSVTSFSVAVDRNYQGTGQERQADFINVVAWRQTAEFVTRYFRKGQMIAVQGSIQTRKYEDRNGNKRTAVEVVANNVSFCGSKAEQPGEKGNPQNYPVDTKTPQVGAQGTAQPYQRQTFPNADPSEFLDIEVDDLPF